MDGTFLSYSIGVLPIDLIVSAQYVPHGGSAVKLKLHGNRRFYLPNDIGGKGCKSQSLKGLRLSNMNLFGSLPDSIGQMEHLEELALPNNSLQGSLPPCLPSCIHLMRLDLGANKLCGPFPSSVLKQMECMKELRMPWNHFTGKFEDIVAQLPSFIRILDIGANRIEGSIPVTLHRLEKLRELYLYKNNLQSVIPEDSFNLCRFLQVISIECNHFYGVLPLDMLRMKKLKVLYCSHNHFEDLTDFMKEMKKKFAKEPDAIFEHILIPQTPMNIANVVERFSN